MCKGISLALVVLLFAPFSVSAEYVQLVPPLSTLMPKGSPGVPDATPEQSLIPRTELVATMLNFWGANSSRNLALEESRTIGTYVVNRDGGTVLVAVDAYKYTHAELSGSLSNPEDRDVKVLGSGISAGAAIVDAARKSVEGAWTRDFSTKTLVDRVFMIYTKDPVSGLVEERQVSYTELQQIGQAAIQEENQAIERRLQAERAEKDAARARQDAREAQAARTEAERREIISRQERDQVETQRQRAQQDSDRERYRELLYKPPAHRTRAEDEELTRMQEKAAVKINTAECKITIEPSPTCVDPPQFRPPPRGRKVVVCVPNTELCWNKSYQAQFDDEWREHVKRFRKWQQGGGDKKNFGNRPLFDIPDTNFSSRNGSSYTWSDSSTTPFPIIPKNSKVYTDPNGSLRLVLE